MGEYFFKIISPSRSVKISRGVPSRSRRVRRISLGITTRPRSSILLTIPDVYKRQYQAGKDEKNVIQLVDEELEGITAQVIAPIICEGDAIGSVSLMSREPKARFGEMEMKLAVTAAGFLGRQMES